MRGESVEMVARRWASCGEAEIRRRGGGKGRLEPDGPWPPGVVGEWEPGEFRGAKGSFPSAVVQHGGEKGKTRATDRFCRSCLTARK